MKKCPKCGVEVFETMSICPKCFSFISNEEKHENVENKNNDILNDNNILKEEDNEKIYDVSYENYFTKYLTDIIVKHYCDFKGRAGRKEFWLFILNLLVIYFVLHSINTELGSIFDLLVILPMLSLYARRVHDFNFNDLIIIIGFFFMVCFRIAGLVSGVLDFASALTGLITIFVTLVIGLIPGTKGENKYGTINS